MLSIPSPMVQAESAFFAQNYTTNSRSVVPLKAGDLVRITVVGFPELSSEQSITSDGFVYLPMIGEISTAGLSTEDATARITTSLLPYVRRPQVSITLVNPSSLRISVTGEVLNPGPRLLEFENLGNNRNNSSIRLSQVLIAAGGITPAANLQNILIRRQSPNFAWGISPDRSANLVTEANLWQAIQTGDLSADPIIYDGDEIVVPTAVNSNTDQQTLLTSTVAPSQVVINVAGEVRRPGPIQIAPTADINAAIAAAGGSTPDADTDSITLFRMNENGLLSQENFEFGTETTTVMNGDLIVVRKSSTSSVLDFLGDIANPIRLLLDVF